MQIHLVVKGLHGNPSLGTFLKMPVERLERCDKWACLQDERSRCGRQLAAIMATVIPSGNSVDTQSIDVLFCGSFEDFCYNGNNGIAERFVVTAKRIVVPAPPEDERQQPRRGNTPNRSRETCGMPRQAIGTVQDQPAESAECEDVRLVRERKKTGSRRIASAASREIRSAAPGQSQTCGRDAADS